MILIAFVFIIDIDTIFSVSIFTPWVASTFIITGQPDPSRNIAKVFLLMMQRSLRIAFIRTDILIFILPVKC